MPFLTLPRLARTRPSLAEVTPIAGPRVSVVIPARNEAHQVRTVIESVLASSYPDIEVIVVDDRSTDTTAAVVEALAAAHPALRLVRGTPLPEGWYGKPWACQQGAKVATGAFLLFTDADTRHEPELLGRALAMLQREGADLFTVAPRQLVVTFWERAIMPQVWLLLGFRFHPTRVNAARSPRAVVANGQFMLFPRASYDALGGHAAVRGEVVEDLAMAQRVVASGRRLYMAFAYEFMATRMYRNLREIVEGWSKNLFIGSQQSLGPHPVLRAMAPLLLVAHQLFWLAPPVLLCLALAGACAAWLMPAAVATGLAIGFWAIVSVGMGAPAWYGVAYPAGALLTLYIVLRSTWRGRRRVEWRGRTYGGPTVSASPEDPAPRSGPP